MLVLTTVGSGPDAASLSRALLSERLCGCVTTLPGAQSLYRWKGEIEEAVETLLLIKTTRARLARLERRLVELHPYELPEFLALDPAKVGRAYARWVADVTA